MNGGTVINCCRTVTKGERSMGMESLSGGYQQSGLILMSTPLSFLLSGEEDPSAPMLL